MDAETAAYHEVYASSMGRPGFLVQHVADAFAAQTATDQTKPIGIVFPLIGLYLYVERGYSGHQVQRMHMLLAKRKRVWPVVQLPANRGSMSAIDVLAAEPGMERDRQIEAWCKSVWSAFDGNRQWIVELLADPPAR
jgi:hypothetical protein